ncbi:MAG: EamA family transporter [Sorangium cellulosum]|nr:MAG: EamA family transporter [Sorangium cellulosum]
MQYGLMYVLYIAAFQHLAAHEVALFTVTTPLFVVVLDDISERRFRPLFVLVSLLAVAGAALIAASAVNPHQALTGFALVQAANFCFALGQVGYRRSSTTKSHHTTFALLYLGAAAVTGLSTLIRMPTISLSSTQVWTLLYLGLIPSGIGFFLWNVGATKTNAGVLGVFNNVKVPLAVAVSLLVFGESTDLLRLGVGGGLIVAALWLGNRSTTNPPTNKVCRHA